MVTGPYRVHLHPDRAGCKRLQLGALLAGRLVSYGLTVAIFGRGTTSGPRVIAGSLPAEPYTGRRIEFRKAAANKVQVDHLYPLARAWDMGAAHWPLRRRIDFANDQAANLLAVDGPANASKNDSGPGEWMPLNRNYRCTYVLRYLQVARKYVLPITANDRDAAQAMTRSCA